MQRDLKIFCEKKSQHSICVPFLYRDVDPEELVVDDFGHKITQIPTTRIVKWDHLSRWLQVGPTGIYDVTTVELDRFLETSRDVHAILGEGIVIENAAGIVKSSGHLPFSSKHGIPLDASERVFENALASRESYGHNWLTLREIERFNWDHKVKRHGFVSPQGWYEYKAIGHPVTWVSALHDSALVIGQIEMNELFMSQNIDYLRSQDDVDNANIVMIDGRKPYCHIEWSQSYNSMAGSFFDTVVKYLHAYSNDDPDSVRIVYWFI